MSEEGSNTKKYMFTIGLGAILGGIAVAWATKALPKMMSGMMHSMMVASEKPETEDD